MEYISREAWETQNRVRELPAANVQPVKHGRWECVGHDDMTKHDKFCSSCGAIMDLKED